MSPLAAINDPSAGSPTDTVLRLSHSSNITVHKASSHKEVTHQASLQVIHQDVQSIEATGGVYKGQGRIRRRILTCIYKVFHVSDKQFQSSVPRMMQIATLRLLSPRRTQSLCTNVARVQPRTSKGITDLL